MNLLWPGFLFLLGLIPLIVLAYIWMLRRRQRFAVRYSSLTLVREALPHQSRLRRHLPFALFLFALAGLVIALARPVASVRVPTGKTNIILAVDVSRSMCSTDIQPNRLAAAQAAALSFVKRQEPSTQIGIVAFAGFAGLIQTPTADQDALKAAIESLTTARRTAVGSAILESLDAIAEVDQTVAPSVTGTSPVTGSTPVPAGAYAPHIIVLLSDGASNTGPLPLDAAGQAVERGVRVYTIGFGTANGAIMDCGPQFQEGDLFGDLSRRYGESWGSGGGRFRRGIDEVTLKRIADMTGGTYYSATSAGELQRVFQNLPIYLSTRQETTEISVGFTAIGALLAGLAILLGLIWHPLP
jgi:Ca-activated chloride channel family protein